jgi:hypothetical protein
MDRTSRERAVNNRLPSNVCATNATTSSRNEDFAEVVDVAKPISTGPCGSGYIREYRGKIADLRRKEVAQKKTVRQATWIYKLGKKNLGNFDCQVGRDLVPETLISKLNHDLLGDEPLENLETWIHVFLYKHALRECPDKKKPIQVSKGA